MRCHRSAEPLVDFLVPARFPSRYRPRLTALSPLDAEVRFAYSPSIFRSGVLASCPVQILLTSGPEVFCRRGILWMEPGSKRTRGRIEFERPMALGELETVCRGWPLSGPPLALPPASIAAAAR